MTYYSSPDLDPDTIELALSCMNTLTDYIISTGSPIQWILSLGYFSLKETKQSHSISHESCGIYVPYVGQVWCTGPDQDPPFSSKPTRDFLRLSKDNANMAMTLSSLCYQYVLMDYIRTYKDEIMSKNNGELLICNQSTAQLHFTIKPDIEVMNRLARGDVGLGELTRTRSPLNTFSAPQQTM